MVSCVGHRLNQATLNDLLEKEAPPPCRIGRYCATNDRPYCAGSNEHQVHHTIDYAKVPLGCNLSDNNHCEGVDACTAYPLENSEDNPRDTIRVVSNFRDLPTYNCISVCANPHASDAIVNIDRLVNSAGLRPVISLSLANIIKKPGMRRAVSHVVNFPDDIGETLTRICEQICNDNPVALAIIIEVRRNGY